MGANASTAVPLYASGQVLDAARLNLTNAGIPVFSGTATRDAAFGGSGEKVLAEGQFAYLEDTNAVQFYDGAAFQAVGAGKIAQVVFGQTNTQLSSSSTTFVTTGLTATITPTLNTSKVLVLVSQNGVQKTVGNSNNGVSLKLLRGATVFSLFGEVLGFTNSALVNIVSGSVCYLDTPATTSATTYVTHFAQSFSATAAIEVQSNSAMSTMILMEVLV